MNDVRLKIDIRDFSIMAEKLQNKETSELDPYTAASLGIVEIVLNCISRDKTYLSKRKSASWTVLMYACSRGHEHLVKILFDLGADVNVSDMYGRTPLMIAATNGYNNLLEILIQQKGALQAVDKLGWSALSYAVYMGQFDCATFLLQQGANANIKTTDKEESVLMLAVKCGHPDIVKLLLDNGADITAVSQSGESALSIAEKYGNATIAECLWTSFMNAGPQMYSVPKFLDFLSLRKYTPLFEMLNLNIFSFVHLSEDDLKRLGISVVGPRKKIMLSIEKWRLLYLERMDLFRTQLWMMSQVSLNAKLQ